VDTAHLLLAFGIVLAAIAVAVGVAQRLRLGAPVAMLGVGMVLGPHSPWPLLTGHVDELQAVGEIGVMLLVFTAGLNTQPKRLWTMRPLVFGLGPLQYALTVVALLGVIAVFVGPKAFHWGSALVVSLGLAMSSSAIPLPLIEARGEEGSPHGRAVIALDLFQSLATIPVLAIIPIVAAGTAQGIQFDFAKSAEVAAAVVGVYLLGRYLLPRALALTAREGGPIGFVVVVLAGVFLAAAAMEFAGVSMALGAFMIGVLLSTSPYADQVKAAAAPAREVLLAVFFIAIGMAIGLHELAAMRSQLALYLPLMLIIKFAVLGILALAFRLGRRAAFLAGLLMMPFDEIGYLILASAHSYDLLPADHYALGLAMISFSFIVSPPLINFGYRLADRMRRASKGPDTKSVDAANHVVVAGYGYVGQAICTMLERAKIPYTAFEVDPEHLTRASRSGRDVHYGDLGDPILLNAINIGRARLAIVLTTRHDLAKRMIDAMRQFYPSVPVVTAVQFLAERDALRRFGAKDVAALVPEGVLAFGRAVLGRLGLPADRVESIANEVSSNDYAALRSAPEAETTAPSAPNEADAAQSASTAAPKSVWHRLRGAPSSVRKSASKQR